MSNKTVGLMHAALDAARAAMQAGDCAWLYAMAVTQAGDAGRLMDEVLARVGAYVAARQANGKVGAP